MVQGGLSRLGSVLAFLTMISQLRQSASASCPVLQDDDVLNNLVQTGYQKVSQTRQARKAP